MTSPSDLPLTGLYGDVILDHYRTPKGRNPLAQPDVEIEEFNPFCGDRVKLQIQFGMVLIQYLIPIIRYYNKNI